MNIFKISALTMLTSACLAATPAAAADLSFVGSFSDPSDVQTFVFVVGAPSNVTLRTWSYAGGTNAAGALIARGGFDPILALFDSTGALIGQNDDGGFANVAADINGRPWDTFLQSALNPGTYTVSIQAFSNFANGPNLSNGFQNDGTFNGRNTNWAFDILNVDSAVQGGAVPEPATWAMMLIGFGAVGFAMRRKKAGNVRVSYA